LYNKSNTFSVKLLPPLPQPKILAGHRKFNLFASFCTRARAWLAPYAIFAPYRSKVELHNVELTSTRYFRMFYVGFYL